MGLFWCLLALSGLPSSLSISASPDQPDWPHLAESEAHPTLFKSFGQDVKRTTSPSPATGSSSATALIHAIYPSNGTNSSQVDSISNKLKDLVTDPKSINASTTKTFGLNFWLAPLTEEAAKKAQDIPDVASVWLNCGRTCPKNESCALCYDPLTSLVYDDLSWAKADNFEYLPNPEEAAKRASDQMRYLSWPPSKIVPANRFVFDDTAGGGVKAYILDTGANLGKDEFELVRDRVRWIPEDGPKDDGTSGPDLYHGTSMLSLVAGKTLGIAKDIDPVIVRLPGPFPREIGGEIKQAIFSPQDWVETLSLINDDLGTQKSSEVRSIVLLAIYYPRSGFPNNDPGGWKTRVHELLLQMESKGALIVTGSGNVPGDAGTLDGWPANFGKRPSQNGFTTIPSLIVAGAISGDGKTAVFAFDREGGIPQVYAPGINAISANGNPDVPNAYKASRGTSDAAAYTAGLAAYFVRLVRDGKLKDSKGNLVKNSPQSIKNFIINGADGTPPGSAWSRMPVREIDRPGIFNAIDITEEQCPWKPGGSNLQQRADSTAACIAGKVPHTTAQSTQISTRSTSVRSTHTSTRTTAVHSTQTSTPITPLEKQHVVCHKESNFPANHPNVDGNLVGLDALDVCKEWKNKLIGPNDSPLSKTFTPGPDYEYTVGWVAGCVTTVPQQNVWASLGQNFGDNDQCTDIFHECWQNCDNSGVGGHIDVGCLRYTFTGGRVNS